MAKIFKLQPNPTFNGDVEIPVPGEAPAKLTFIFAHKGKKALQAFYDGLSPVKPAFDEAGNITNADDVEAATRKDGDAVAELVKGWVDVDAEFNRDNLDLLLDNFPGAALAILVGYRTALMTARVGN